MKILITVLISIILLYLIYLTYALLSTNSFRKKIKDDYKMFDILLFEKERALKELNHILKSNNINVTDYTYNVNQELTNKSIRECFEDLMIIDNDYLFELNKNKEIKNKLMNDVNFIQVTKMSQETNQVYYQVLDSYYYCITGYNYWVKLIIFVPFMRLFKFKPINNK